MQQFKAPALFFACFCILLQLCICVPSPNAEFHRSRRSTASSNYGQSLPLFNISVLSADGRSKIPPKLQTKIYLRPSTTSASNLTDRQIMGERRILTCKSSTATFHHSHCRHMKGVAYSIREYMAWCREPVPPGFPQPTFTLPSEARAMASSTGREDPSLHGDYGTCDMDEVCIDSLYSIDYRRGFVLIANCVKKRLFEDAGYWKSEWDDLEDREGEEFWEGEVGYESGGGESNPGSSSSGLAESSDGKSIEKGQNQEEGKGEQHYGTGSRNQSRFGISPSTLFSGKYASVVITQGEEGITPLEVREIALKSLGNMTSQVSEAAGSASASHGGGELQAGSQKGYAGKQAPAGPLITEQERVCTNCIDLKTLKPFATDTKGLEIEVKMVGAASVTLAGILWIALLSG